MSATYVMVAKKQVPEPPATDSGNAKNDAPPTKKPTKKPPKPEETEKSQDIVANEQIDRPFRSNNEPTVHLDIQIHIPADATPEKIDQIFSSMARHLYAT